MRYFIVILTVAMLTLGCKKNMPDQTVTTHTLKVDNDTLMEPFTNTIYKNDSITIEVRSDNFNYFILSNIKGLKKEYDLTKLNIPTKTPDEIEWINGDYACMMTWWSQAQSRHIFIPVKNENKFVYLDKDIEETDSINNNIVYIDTAFTDRDRIIFKAENLLTRKSKPLTISIGERNSVYPYYKIILLTKNKLTITTDDGQKESVDISTINSKQ